MSNARLDYAKSLWNGGQKKEAMLYFINSIPNWTYPGGPTASDELFSKYGYWSFVGPMAGVTWWREFWHFFAGALMASPLVMLPWLVFWVPVFIMVWKAGSEYFGDGAGNPDLKNVLDVTFWVLGAGSIVIVSFIYFGASTYK